MIDTQRLIDWITNFGAMCVTQQVSVEKRPKNNDITTTVSVTNVVTHKHICPLTPFNVEVTFMFMNWSAKSNQQKQH